MLFTIRPGRYVVPGVGKVDTTSEVPDEKALQLYENKHFPWCEPIIGKETVGFLKKAKLDEKRMASLIKSAKTVEEVEMLLQVKSTKTLKTIAENKISALKVD